VWVAVEGDPAAPACLLIHGAPGSLRDFRYLAPALVAEGLLAVRLDMPGFGGTPFSTWPLQAPAQRAGFVAEVARALGLSRFAVLGHSVGGSAAMLSAALFPDRVSALALVNSVGVQRHQALPGPEGVSRSIGYLLRSERAAQLIIPAMQKLYRQLGFRDVEALDADTLRVHTDLVGSLDFVAHRWAARSARCPILVASSEDDPLVQPRISRGLARAFRPQATLRHLHFQAGGHYLQKHEAARIAQHVREMVVPNVG
jgi:pimeloyl-ACP methyl ester carboxylesterase